LRTREEINGMSWLEDMIRNRQAVASLVADLVLEGRRKSERAAEVEFGALLREQLDTPARQAFVAAGLEVAEQEGY
jgi:hypothetical protein